MARKFYSNKSERKQSPRQFLHRQIRDMDSYLQEMVRSVPHTPTTQAMFDEYNDILNRWRRLEQLRCNDKTFTDIMMRCAFPDAMRLCHIMDDMEIYRGKA